MEEKETRGFEFILISIGIIVSFVLLLFSEKLSITLVKELVSGRSIIELLFDIKDHISFSKNLALPLFLEVTGISFLLLLLWNIGKNIFCNHGDSLFSKIALVILSLFLLAMLVRAIIISWSLMIITFALMTVGAVILFTIYSFLHTDSRARY